MRAPCAVCLEDLVHDVVTLQPCRHMLCRSCSARAVLPLGLKCPMCRSLTTALAPAAIGASSVTTIIAFDVRPGTHAGIRVCDDTLRGCVRIVSLIRNDVAYVNGLRQGDRIWAVNGILALHHRDVIAVIQSVCDFGGSLAFAICQRGAARLPSTALHEEKMERLKIQASARLFHARLDEWNRSHTS